jgi:hypothetical protein
MRPVQSLQGKGRGRQGGRGRGGGSRAGEGWVKEVREGCSGRCMWPCSIKEPSLCRGGSARCRRQTSCMDGEGGHTWVTGVWGKGC